MANKTSTKATSRASESVDPTFAVLSDSSSPFLQAEARELIGREIKRFPEPDRQVLEQVIMERLTPLETCRTLDVRPTEVKRILQDGVATLKATLEAAGVDTTTPPVAVRRPRVKQVGPIGLWALLSGGIVSAVIASGADAVIAVAVIGLLATVTTLMAIVVAGTQRRGLQPQQVHEAGRTVGVLSHHHNKTGVVHGVLWAQPPRR